MKSFPFGLLIFLFSSCHRSVDVEVSNNIPNVEIDEIRFAGREIGCCLQPGTKLVEEVRLERNEQELEGKVSFLMRANGQTIRLVTREHYQGVHSDLVLIELSTSTRVELDY